MTIIPENKLKTKRLKKLMGEDYYTKPALRLILGRSVEWADLETERERKIAVTYFWKGVEQAQRWVKEGIL